MDIAADKIEALLNVAESKLQSIELQLEVDMTKHTKMQLNPVAILTNIEEFKKELALMKQEQAKLAKEREEVKEKLIDKLKLVCKKSQAMDEKLGKVNKMSSKSDSVMKDHLRM